eukprot:240385-Chlamydomonas_euryale.AAC.1
MHSGKEFSKCSRVQHVEGSWRRGVAVGVRVPPRISASTPRSIEVSYNGPAWCGRHGIKPHAPHRRPSILPPSRPPLPRLTSAPTRKAPDA